MFLGGIPWDISESTLVSAFEQFGPVKVEWPGRDQSPTRAKGYAYVVFEEEQQVSDSKVIFLNKIIDPRNIFFIEYTPYKKYVRVSCRFKITNKL